MLALEPTLWKQSDEGLQGGLVGSRAKELVCEGPSWEQPGVQATVSCRTRDHVERPNPRRPPERGELLTLPRAENLDSGGDFQPSCPGQGQNREPLTAQPAKPELEPPQLCLGQIERDAALGQHVCQ
ncbi:hypothetical protein Bbelb_007600 [Branchiostoma belcheri]|nr:hypothetical protein Bbelb_007600 [Branchiostoma belcheri]